MGEYTNVVVIPVYQPKRELIETVNSLVHTKKYKIIVVDDGSLPDTKPIFDEIKKFVTVIYHMEKRGRGAAIKTALSYIKKHYDNAIVTTIDINQNNTIADIENVSAKALAIDNGIVISSSTFNKKMSLKIKLVNKLRCKMLKMLSGIYVKDTQMSISSFKSSLIPYLLKIDGNRNEYEINMLMRCAKDNVSIMYID